jgi:hypothetical protein
VGLISSREHAEGHFLQCHISRQHWEVFLRPLVLPLQFVSSSCVEALLYFDGLAYVLCLLVHVPPLATGQYAGNQDDSNSSAHFQSPFQFELVELIGTYSIFPFLFFYFPVISSVNNRVRPYFLPYYFKAIHMVLRPLVSLDIQHYTGSVSQSQNVD